MPPSGVDYASEFLNGYAPEYVQNNRKTYIFSLKNSNWGVGAI
jgi:hypothetical protein